MTIADYLAQFTRQNRITLIGPLATLDCHPDPNFPLIWVDGGVDCRPAPAPVDIDADANANANTDAIASGFAVGDGDSAQRKLDQYLPQDKDYSDLAFVLAHLPAHFTDLDLRGFLGGRSDHELFNLGEIHHFLAAAPAVKRAPTRARFDREITAYSRGTWQFTINGTFSLATFAAAEICLTGACKFPLPRPTVISAVKSIGLSNVGEGEMTLKTAAPVFVFHRLTA